MRSLTEQRRGSRIKPERRGTGRVAYTAQALPDEIAGFREAGFDEVLVTPERMAVIARASPTPPAPV